MTITVTKHAIKRFKQRVGLPKSACQKQAELAYRNGISHGDVTGNARKFLDKLFLIHRSANQLRVYGEHVYLFAGTTLITVMHLPNNLKNAFGGQ